MLLRRTGLQGIACLCVHKFGKVGGMFLGRCVTVPPLTLGGKTDSWLEACDSGSLGYCGWCTPCLYVLG